MIKPIEVTPTKDENGKETVTLWGRTFDVTGKNKITAFKRDFKIVRPKKTKKIEEEEQKDE